MLPPCTLVAWTAATAPPTQPGVGRCGSGQRRHGGEDLVTTRWMFIHLEGLVTDVEVANLYIYNL